MKKYYTSRNPCRENWNALEVAFLFLLIEAYLNFFVCWCLSWGICWLVGLFCMGRRIENERRQNNLRIQDLLVNAAQLKINPQDYQNGDACSICMEEFKENENILCLPCNRNHIFHKDWIAQWVAINNNCPLCKKEITKELIENADAGSVPLVENDQNRNNQFT